MPDGKLTFEQACDLLFSWAKTLANHVPGSVSQAADALQRITPLPDGCPSKESLARMCMRDVEQDIEEAMYAYDEIQRSIGMTPQFEVFFKMRDAPRHIKTQVWTLLEMKGAEN